MLGRPWRPPPAAATRAARARAVGKGQMGSALMGSLQISCLSTEGPFGYSRYPMLISPKVPGRTFCPQPRQGKPSCCFLFTNLLVRLSLSACLLLRQGQVGQTTVPYKKAYLV